MELPFPLFVVHVGPGNKTVEKDSSAPRHFGTLKRKMSNRDAFSYKYKLGTNWQTRTPFSKLLDPRLMQQWFWGYFHKKILRLTLIVSYIKLFIFIFIFVCASSEWYSNNQNYEESRVGRVEHSSCKPQKSKIDKNHSYAIFPCKNNNHIFYDFWD